MGNIFSSKSFINRYGPAKTIGGPARRDLSKKETRLSEKLDTTQKESADHYFENRDDKNYNKKQDRYEKKELRVEQKLDKEKRKQSRKKFGLEKDPHKKEIRQSNKQERKDLKAKQKRFEERRKEKESGPAKTVEELKQKKKDMQLGKHRVKPGGDPKNVKKFNKKIGRINKRIDNKSDDEGAGPAKKTKGERQKGRADKKAARQQARAKKRIDRNEGKQARIKKNTQSSSDPAVRASGKARIERAKKRVKKNKTVSPDYVSKKDKANIAKDEKNKPGLKNPPPSSKQETPLSAADKGDDFDKFLSPAKKTKRKGLLRRANKEIARKNTDSKKVQRLVEKYVEKNK